MTVPRRRVIRPIPSQVPTKPQHPQRFQKLQARLEREQHTLTRWMAKLKRAFHAVEKGQQCVARLQRQIARMEVS
jgi:lipid II:glycine glycyltransferase (peptidoglycan interpeptide bridge formation enzyme)